MRMRNGWLLLAMAVSTAHAQSCRVAAAALQFGTYDPSSRTPYDSATQIALSCVPQSAVSGAGNTLSFEIALSGDAHARALQNGSYTLRYVIYSDAARTQLWGDGTGGGLSFKGGLALTGNLTTAEAVIPIYGRLPSGQWIPPGGYSDVITVVVSF